MSQPQLIKWKRLSDIWISPLWEGVGGKVIAPNPSIADFIRNLMATHKQLPPHWSVQTLPEFQKQVLGNSENWGEWRRRSWGRAEIKLGLARYLRNKGKAFSYGQFNNIYTLWSELRSFTSVPELLDELIDFFPVEQERVALKLCQQWCEDFRPWDEAAILNQCALELVALEKNSFIFWGFGILSGCQIDFLKTLSEVHEVGIVVSQSFLNNCSPSDWPHWLSTHPIEVEDFNIPQVALCPTPAGNIPILLKQQSQKSNDHLVVSASPTIDFENWLYLPPGQRLPKVSYEVFSHAMREWENEVGKIFLEGKFSGIYTKANQSILLQKSLKKGLAHFKVLALVFEIIEKYVADASWDHWEWNKFDIDLIREVVSLELPRLSLVQFEAEFQNIGDTHNLGLYDGIILKSKLLEGAGRISLILHPQWLPMESRQKVLPQKLEEKLFSIGPLARAELSIWNIQSLILEFIHQNKDRMILYYPPDLRELSPQWDKFLSLIEAQEIERVVHFDLRAPDVLNYGKINLPPFISVTSLQNYLDCPRKFYQKNHLKFSSFIEMEKTLNEAEKGTLWHTLLAHLYTQADSEDMDLEKMKEIIEKYIKNKKPNLAENEGSQFSEYSLTVLKNSLNFLRNLQYTMKAKIEFEGEVEVRCTDKFIRGRFDCLLKSDQGIYFIDFKKTNASVPNKTDLKNFREIQLWAYSVSTGHDLPVKGFAYYSLEDNEPLFYGDWPATFSSIGPGTWDQEIEEAKKYIEHTITKLCSDEIFPANPISSSICRNCDFAIFCPKGSVDEDSE